MSIGLEFRRPFFAAQVIADPQRVAFLLVNRQERLARVRPLGAGRAAL